MIFGHWCYVTKQYTVPKRLCKRDHGFLEALKALKYNYLKSCFCKALFDDMV